MALAISSARDDRDAFASGPGKTLEIAGIAREDAVTMCGDEHDCGIDRITCSSTAKKNARLATQLLIEVV